MSETQPASIVWGWSTGQYGERELPAHLLLICEEDHVATDEGELLLPFYDSLDSSTINVHLDDPVVAWLRSNSIYVHGEDLCCEQVVYSCCTCEGSHCPLRSPESSWLRLSLVPFLLRRSLGVHLHVLSAGSLLCLVTAHDYRPTEPSPRLHRNVGLSSNQFCPFDTSFVCDLHQMDRISYYRCCHPPGCN